jgi:hypothetical protein
MSLSHIFSYCSVHLLKGFRWKDNDEEITPMQTAKTSPIVIQGPITRARA